MSRSLLSTLAVVSLVLGVPLVAQQQFAEPPPTTLFPGVVGDTWAVAVGDVDGDGDADFISGNDSSPLRLFENNGAGAFTDRSATHLPALADATRAVVLADFDGDTDLDCVVGNVGQVNRLLRNDGSGRFTEVSPNPFALYADPTRSLVVLDREGDGDLDVVVANSGDVNRLYVNDGRGGFAHRSIDVVPPRFGATWHVAAPDVDRDGDPDLVFANHREQSRVYLNDGEGFFLDVTDTWMPAAQRATTALVVRDFDGDGDADLMLGDEVSCGHLYDNVGTSYVDVSSRLPCGARRTDFAEGTDVDGDGDTDLMVGATGGSERWLFLNTGGVFVDAGTTPFSGTRPGTKVMRAIDADGDGDLDLVEGGDGRNELLRNDGSVFVAGEVRESLSQISGGGVDLIAADVDLDGDPDVVAGGAALVHILENDGRGILTPSTQFGGTGGTDSVAVADFDGDGDPDVVTARLSGATTWRNDGRGGFTEVVESFPRRSLNAVATVAGDVDGDGDQDVFFAMSRLPRRNLLMLNDGDGVFVAATSRLPATTEETEGALLRDFDGDGDLDLFAANYASASRLYVNDGDGFFTDVSAAQLPTFSDFVADVAAGDVDGDGDLDVLVATTVQRNRLLLNDGRGYFQDESSRLPLLSPSSANSVALADADADGDLDVILGGRSNRLYINDGAGTFVDVSTARLPPISSNTNRLLAADLDRDGDPDLITRDSQELRYYVNHHRQLRASRFPVVAAPYDVHLFAAPGYATAAHLGLVLFGAGIAARPISVLGMGSLFVLPPWEVSVPAMIPTTGGATLRFAVPGDPALIGVELALQGAVVATGGRPALTGYSLDAIRPGLSSAASRLSVESTSRVR
ncbi:MAG: VCBS repeat-containing protein [Planctomycetota bacterium]